MSGFSGPPIATVAEFIAGTTGKILDASVHSNTPSFSAHKNGVDQTGIADITFTEVSFGTEVYDVGGYFASNTWTPPAGKIALTSAFLASGTWASGAQIAIAIYKNGSPLKQANWFSAAANQGAAFISCDDISNGTDAYTVMAYMDMTSGTGTLSGTTANTYFVGRWSSP